ncbi:MAG: glycosyltransferase family 4 protein [Acidobacteria bacterium]|nr:glycosyltransferase family 4 protein [Acidobacteriota bacterium]
MPVSDPFRLHPSSFTVRLVILNQFFYPDHSATSQLMTDLAESLVARGFGVTALAGRGRYNGGGGLAPREEYRGVKVVRAWATGYGKGSVAGRLADYFTFYLGAAWKLLTLPRHDVVLALTTPPLIGLLALLVCRLRGMRLAALVQDVYPDVGVALGTFREGSLVTRLLDRLNRTVLSRADRIIVLGDCMRERVSARAGDGGEAKIDVIHNWADGEKIHPLAEGAPNDFADGHGLRGRFVVQFSGNFGRVNDFDTPLEAARLLKGREDVLFLFIGDGAKAAEMREFVRRHELCNVRFLPYQPREALLHSLAAGDAHLVTLAPGLAGLSVPSKTYGILAAGRPLLFVGDTRSDVARLVAEHRCGEVVPTGDAEALARVISAWADDPSRARRMGLEARELFLRRFDRPHAVDAYAESLLKCLPSAAAVEGRGRSAPEVGS